MKTWALIRNLEQAVFSLKEHLMSMDVSSKANHADAKSGKRLTNVRRNSAINQDIESCVVGVLAIKKLGVLCCQALTVLRPTHHTQGLPPHMQSLHQPKK